MAKWTCHHLIFHKAVSMWNDLEESDSATCGPLWSNLWCLWCNGEAVKGQWGIGWWEWASGLGYCGIWQTEAMWLIMKHWQVFVYNKNVCINLQDWSTRVSWGSCRESDGMVFGDMGTRWPDLHAYHALSLQVGSVLPWVQHDSSEQLLCVISIRIASFNQM